MFDLGFILNEYTIFFGVQIIAYVIYKWSVSTFDFFEQIGIPFDKPVPFFGSSLWVMLSKDTMHNMLSRIHNNFRDSKVYGVFEMRKPTIVIRDPELIRQLAVKNFEHFLNHQPFADEKSEPIFGRNLFALRNQRWKDMRSTLSPVFTGSKMREMFYLITDVLDRSMAHLREEAKFSDLVCDSKDMTTRFANDFTASTAFGLEVNSFENKENEFFVMGRKLAFSNKAVIMKVLLKLSFPKICNLLRVRIFPTPIMDRFCKIVKDTMDEREISGVVRRDVIQLLMQAQKGVAIQREFVPSDHSEGFATVQEHAVGLQSSKTRWDFEDLVAQCFGFFFAGSENVATVTCFVIQELIENRDIQQILYEEIVDTYLQLNGNPISYEIIQKMTYMDQIICETLRKWPTAPQTDRVCNKPFNLEVDGNIIPIKVGNVVTIPIYAMHHDPECFENPDKFDPSRFNDDNKHKIKPFTYIPFGVGPRNCIASRMALMEVKAIIYALVINFQLVPSEQTQVPLQIAKGFVVKPEKGFWVKLKLRN